MCLAVSRLRVLVLPMLVVAGTALGPGSALGSPVRLGVRVGQRVLNVGDRVRVTVEFLDRGYHAVRNDRKRSVTLRALATGRGSSGSGEIAPTTTTVSSGVTSSSEWLFTAKTPGRLTIEASSDGLAPGRELVNIVRRKASFLSRLLFPPVNAQSPPLLRIFPRDEVRVPVNGVSSAQLWVTLDSADASEPRVRHARVTTSPVVQINYAGRQTRGFTQVEIDGELGQSERIDILAPEPGPVKVSAVMSSGETDTVEVVFVAPHPRKILIDPDHVTVPSHQTLLPLTVTLADQEGLRIRTMVRAHEIELRSVSGRQVSFEPPAVRLSPDRPAAHTTLDLKGVPTGVELALLASDVENDLAPGSANVKVALAGYVLLLLAGLGGLLGGLARHVYRVGTPTLWPARVRGRIDPGVVGNVFFGSLFGLVLFQAAQLGLVYAARFEGAAEDCTLAFFLGILGGIGGILLGERLIDLILPEPKGALTPSKG
jgi:hypothetical protein